MTYLCFPLLSALDCTNCGGKVFLPPAAAGIGWWNVILTLVQYSYDYAWLEWSSGYQSINAGCHFTDCGLYLPEWDELGQDQCHTDNDTPVLWSVLRSSSLDWVTFDIDKRHSLPFKNLSACKLNFDIIDVFQNSAWHVVDTCGSGYLTKTVLLEPGEWNIWDTTLLQTDLNWCHQEQV